MKKLITPIFIIGLFFLSGCSIVDKALLQEVKNQTCNMMCKGIIEYTGGCYITRGWKDELNCYKECVMPQGSIDTGTVEILKKDCIFLD